MSKSEPAEVSSIATEPSVPDAAHFHYSVPSPGLAVVRNVRHDDPEAHTYAVNVASGEAVQCSCPADEYHPGACKHRQAVEANPAVLLAAASEARQ